MADKDLEKLEQELAWLTPEERQRDFQKRAFGFAMLMVMLVGIWALVGAGYFWPGWVLLFGGLDLMKRAYTTYVNPPDPLELEE